MMNFILFDVWGGGKIIIYIYIKTILYNRYCLFNNKKTQLLILKGGPWGGGLAYIYISIYIYIYLSARKLT